MKRKLSPCASTAGGDGVVEPRDKQGDSDQISNTGRKMSQARDEDRDSNSSSSRSRKAFDLPPPPPPQPSSEGEGCVGNSSNDSILVRQNACNSSAIHAKEIPPPAASPTTTATASPYASSSDLPLICPFSSERDLLVNVASNSRPKGRSFNTSLSSDLLVHSPWTRFFFTSPSNENYFAISDCVRFYQKKKKKLFLLFLLFH